MCTEIIVVDVKGPTYTRSIYGRESELRRRFLIESTDDQIQTSERSGAGVEMPSFYLEYGRRAHSVTSYLFSV